MCFFKVSFHIVRSDTTSKKLLHEEDKVHVVAIRLDARENLLVGGSIAIDYHERAHWSVAGFQA